MAVKREKMIERFKALFPKVNLSKERLNMLMDKLKGKPADDAEDSVIDGIINDFDEIYPFSDIAKEDDKNRKLAADKAKLEEDAKKGGSKKDDEDEDDEDDEDDDLPEETPEWAKKMFKQNKKLAKTNETLKSELEGIKSGKVTDTRSQQIKDLFGGSDVLKGLTPEIQNRLMKTVDFESDTPVEDQITSIESEYSELVQSQADKNDYAGGAGSGSSEIKVDAEKVDAVLDNMNV